MDLKTYDALVTHLHLAGRGPASLHADNLPGNSGAEVTLDFELAPAQLKYALLTLNHELAKYGLQADLGGPGLNPGHVLAHTRFVVDDGHWNAAAGRLLERGQTYRH